MFSKTTDKLKEAGRPISLATRMTLWYALSAFALILMASGFLYRALSDGLDHEDDVLLSQKFQSLTTRLNDPTTDQNDLREFVGELPVWYRNTSF
jgi:two-component system heavy metal sensor histidine kinase CusS